jgi:hypothetical protein
VRLTAEPLSDAGEIESELRGTLPRDHPVWQRDIVSVSARIREALERIRPVVVRVLSFWDHALRSATIGGRRVEVDPSGCYRLH